MEEWGVDYDRKNGGIGDSDKENEEMGVGILIGTMGKWGWVF
jgi:hypothetical protein